MAAGVIGLVSLWTVAGFALAGDGDQGELLVRLVAMLAVAAAGVWLVAAGFDARYPASHPGLVAVRLVGVVAAVAVALLVAGDPWVFAGEGGSAVGVDQQVLIAGLALAGLGAAFAYQRRRPPAAVPAGSPPPGGSPAPGPVAPGTGFRATLQRWPHLIVALAVVGPLVVFEGIVWLLYTYCGPGGAGSGMVAVLVLTLPFGLPAVGVLRDRQWQRRASDTSPGFAVAFGTIVVVAIVHLALVFALLALFAVGTEGSGGRCFS
ncbi:MAG: hypothetical protein R2761_10850 [Acidimicrobiales bacterium]